MMKLKNVFAVSIIAMFAVGASHATVVTQTRLESAIAGKANTADLGTAAYTDSSAYDAAGAATTAKNDIEGKLDDGATGYDIDAKSLKVQGTSVLTSHQSITEGTSNGTIKVGSTDVAVHGLGSAAYTASTAYATAAQGTTADNTASAVNNATTGLAATKAIADAAIPAPALTDLATNGTVVLTAKAGEGNTVVYKWETIGR